MDGLDLTLPRRAACVRVGRDALHALRDSLGLAGYEEARLLVSELLTNAVVHGEGETMRLKVTETDEGHLFEIIDAGGGFTPQIPPPRSRGAGGQGLVLVDRLAESWGVFEGDSTHVWFTLRKEAGA